MYNTLYETQQAHSTFYAIAFHRREIKDPLSLILSILWGLAQGSSLQHVPEGSVHTSSKCFIWWIQPVHRVTKQGENTIPCKQTPELVIVS